MQTSRQGVKAIPGLLRPLPLLLAVTLLASFVSFRGVEEDQRIRESAAAGRRSVRALDALADTIEGRPGEALSRKPRARMLKFVTFAERQLKDGDVCSALRAIDFLRQPLADPASYRGKGVPTAARTLDRRVVAADNAMLGKAEAEGCAVKGTMSDAVTLEPVGEPVPPRDQVKRIDQGEELAQEPGEGDGPAWSDPGEPVEVVPAPKTGARAPAGETDPNSPVRITQRTDVGVAGGSSPHDMQVTSAANVVLVSGNGGAFYSIDSGQTFRPMNQATVFGTGEGGFCCDPVLRYAPRVDRFLWLLQGQCAAPDTTCTQSTVNRMVLAVSSPAVITDVAQAGQPIERAWSTAQITQALLGETNTWWDYPAMSVGATQLYLIWNRQRSGALADGTKFLRINLAELARGSFRIFHFSIDGSFFGRLAQQSGPLGMLVKNVDMSDAEVFYIHETSGIAFRAVLPHQRIPSRDYSSASPGGSNWTGMVQGSAVKGATVSGERLWVAWGAGRGYPGQTNNVFPQPHVQFAVYRIQTGGLFEGIASVFGTNAWQPIQEGNLWNGGYAILDPALDTNAEGDVGIVFSYGGPTQEPSAAAGIITGRGIELHQILGADSVSPGFDNIHGHYNGIHRDSPNGVRFVATGVLVKNDPPGPQPHYVFMRFGRD